MRHTNATHRPQLAAVSWPLLLLCLLLGTSCENSSSSRSSPPPVGAASPALPESRVLIFETGGALRIVDGFSRSSTGPVNTGPIQPVAAVLDPLRNRLWLADPGADQVSIHDATTLAQIAVVSSAGSPNAIALDTSQALIFVANRAADTVRIFSADAPYAEVADSPVMVGNTPSDIVVEDSTVVVSNRDDGTLTVFSTAAPFTAVAGSPFTVGAGPEDLEVDPNDNLVFVANRDGNSISVFDIGLATVATPITGVMQPTAIARHPRRDLLFVANEMSGNLRVYTSTATPTENADSPIALGTTLTGVTVNSFLDRVFVTESTNGTTRILEGEAPFSTLDSGSGIGVGSAPSGCLALEPMVVQSLVSPNGGSVLDSFVDGNRLFLAHGTTGVLAIDLTNPRAEFNDRLLGTLSVPGSVESVLIRDDWAFISNGGSGVQVADIEDVTDMDIVRTVNGIGTADEMWFFGAFLLVETGSGGLRILDVRIPQQSFAVSNVNPGGGGTGFDVDLEARFAYSASGGTDFRVIDFFDPLSPITVETVPVPVDADDVAVFDDRTVAIASGVGGLQIARVFPVTGSQVVGQLDLAVAASRVQSSGSLALVIDTANDLHVVQTRDSENPSFIGFIDLPGTPRTIRTSGRNLHVALEGAGLWIYRFYP